MGMGRVGLVTLFTTIFLLAVAQTALSTIDEALTHWAASRIGQRVSREGFTPEYFLMYMKTSKLARFAFAWHVAARWWKLPVLLIRFLLWRRRANEHQ